MTIAGSRIRRNQGNESCRTILLRKEQDPVMITKLWQRIHFYRDKTATQ